MLEYIKIHPLLDPIVVIHGGFLVSWLGVGITDSP